MEKSSIMPSPPPLISDSGDGFASGSEYIEYVAASYLIVAVTMLFLLVRTVSNYRRRLREYSSK